MAHPNHNTARRRWLLRFAVVLLVGAWAVSPPAAQAAVVRVEEDWELVISDPDPNCDSPQITCTISPVGDIAAVHAAFDLNQRSFLEFNAGGLQLQLWNGETAVAQITGPSGGLLCTAGERIQWTQSMELAEGSLIFQVSGGTSTTWGAFGAEGSLRLSVPAGLSSLDGYDPRVTVRNTGVGYAANRVQSLVLKRVRYYSESGESWEDNTERLVHQQ